MQQQMAAMQRQQSQANINFHHQQQNSQPLQPTNPFFNHQASISQPINTDFARQQSLQMQQQNAAYLAQFKQSLNAQDDIANINDDDSKHDEAKKNVNDKEAKRQRNLVRAVDELIATEKTYIEKLEILQKIYINPM